MCFKLKSIYIVVLLLICNKFVLQFQILKNFEKIAQLSDRCFAVMVDIEKKLLEGELSSTTKAKRISQAFFQFVYGKSEQESFDLLTSVLEKRKTVTELNYVPSGKVL